MAGNKTLMPRALLFGALVAAVLLLAGCNTSFNNCCPANGNCTIQNNTIYMSCSNGICNNATLGINLKCLTNYTWCTDANGNDTPYLSCTNAVSSVCVNNNCNAMICGYTDYNPAPTQTASDQLNGTQDSNLARPIAVNLLNAQCQFKPLTAKTNADMKRSRGSLWINAFRFGVGSSFSDYEDSRDYFPISDSLCAANSFGTKDRYMNYLNMRNAHTCDVISGFGVSIATCAVSGVHYFSFIDYGSLDYLATCQQSCGAFDPLVCSSAQNASLFPFLNASSSYAATTDNFWWKQDCDRCGGDSGGCKSPWYLGGDCRYDDGSLGIGVLYSPTEIYYRNITENLKVQYSQSPNEFVSGYTDSSGNHHNGAEFECTDNMQCISGNCNKNIYTRSACVNASNTNQEIDCGCYVDTFDYKVKCNMNSTYDTQVNYGPAGWMDIPGVQSSPPMIINGESAPPLLGTSIVATSDINALRNTVPLLRACNVPASNISVTAGWTVSGSARWEYQISVTGLGNRIGDCLIDPNAPGKLKVNTYGVCDACTISTIAQQDVWDVGTYYCPYSWESKNFPQNPILGSYPQQSFGSGTGDSRAVEICGMQRWDQTCGGHDQDQAQCAGSDSGSTNLCSGSSGYGCLNYHAWPRLGPEVTYVRQKVKDYLSANVMPIINTENLPWYSTAPQLPPFFSQSSSSNNLNSNPVQQSLCDQVTSVSPVYQHTYTNQFFSCTPNSHISQLSDKECSQDVVTPTTAYWHTNWDCTKTNELFNWNVVNQGATLVNIGNAFDLSNDEIASRALGVRKYCPQCLVGLHVGNPNGTTPATTSANIQRLDNIFNYQTVPTPQSWNQTMLGSIDVMLLDFYPNNYTDYDPNLATDPQAVQHIYNNLTDYSRTILAHYNKPSIVTHFDIREPAPPLPVTSSSTFTPYDGNTGSSFYNWQAKDSPSQNPGFTVTSYWGILDAQICGGGENKRNYVGGYMIQPNIPSGATLLNASITSVFRDDKGIVSWEDTNSVWRSDEWGGYECGGQCGPVTSNVNWPLEVFWNNQLELGYSIMNTCGGDSTAIFGIKYTYLPAPTTTFWTPDNENAMYGQLFNNTGDMVDAGLLGIIYDKWNTDLAGIHGSGGDTSGLAPLTSAYGDGEKGDKFCSFQTNSLKTLGITKSTAYVKVFPQDTCDCQPCNQVEIELGLCNPYCATGATCTNAPGGNTAGQKCPANCYTPQTCVPCSSFSQNYSCTYDYGTSKTTYNGSINSLNNLYGDVVASLPTQPASATNYKCCVTETLPDNSTVNYTYVKQESSQQKNELDIFPKDGNPGTDCGHAPSNTQLPNCGFTLPLTAAKITCTVS